MRPTFTHPSTEITNLDNLHRRTHMTAISPEKLDSLETLFSRFETYRKHAFWGNPKTSRRYRQALNEAKRLADFASIRALRQLTQTISREQKRYHWNQRLIKELSEPAFWEQPLDNKPTLQQHCMSVGPYAYYRAQDLDYLIRSVFSPLEQYIAVAQTEIARLNRRTWRQNPNINELQTYLANLKATLKTEQAKIADTMLMRLQLAAAYQDIAFDDVVYDLSKRLKAAGSTHEDLARLGPRPYQTPRRGFTQKDFYRYHHFIQKYGDERTKAALQNLPWVREGLYIYDASKRIWKTHPNIIPHAKIPTSRWSLGWLSRGRNARYDALHDVRPYLKIRMYLASLTSRRERLAAETEDDIDPSALQHLDQTREFLQAEQERINRIQRRLKPVIHSRSKRVLGVYTNSITEAVVALVSLQQISLEKAQHALPSIIDDDTKLEHVMQQLDQLSETLRLLPENHALVPAASQLQNTLRHQIARHKLDAFSLAITQLPFQRKAVYDGHGVVYRLADQADVTAYFTRITKYLWPEQAQALELIAGLLTGDHYREGNIIAYDDIVTAMGCCFEEPMPVVQTIVEHIIAPSIRATDTIGYALLSECESRLGTGRRANILRTVAEQKKIMVWSALQRILTETTPVDASTTVKVGGQDVSVEQFTAQVRCLELPKVEPLVKKYLDTFQGDQEAHWRVFEVMPTVHAITYAHRRLSFLLAQGDYNAIAESPCLSVLERTVREAQTATNATLAGWVNTVTFGMDEIPAMDHLIERFADQTVQAMWEARREQYLLTRFNALLHQTDTADIEALSMFLRENGPFPRSDTAKANLARQLQYVPHDAWTTQHHALVDTIEDVALRQIYYAQWLKRILADRDFARAHEHLIPSPEDVSGCFEMMTAPQFKTVCEMALDRFEYQLRIKNVSGFRILANLLMHDVTAILDMNALASRMHTLLDRFKAEVDFTLQVRAVLSLIDTRHFDRAKAVLRDLREKRSFYESLDDQTSHGEITQSILMIVKGIRARLNRPIDHTDGTPLLPEAALNLLAEMPTAIPAVEQCQWELQQADHLHSLVSDLQREIAAMRDKQATTLPALPLFHEAIKRGVLRRYCSEDDQQELVIQLRTVTEDEDFATQPEASRHILLALLRLLKGNQVASDASVFSRHEAAVAGEAVVNRTAEHDDAPEPLSENRADMSAVIPFEPSTEASRPFIEYFEFHTKECHQNMSEQLSALLSPTHPDPELKSAVHEDLLQYFKYLCLFVRENVKTNPTQAAKAQKSINRMHLVLSHITAQPEGDVFVLIKKASNIPSRPQKMVIALQGLLLGEAHKTDALLDRFLLAILEHDLLYDTFREEWVQFMEQQLLPVLNNTVRVSPQLSAALHSLYRVLKKDYSEADRNNIVAYEQHYKDVVIGSVRHTSATRLRAEATTAPAVTTEDRTTARGFANG